jgi:hypothetical protein
MPQSLYVWQRTWGPSVKESIAQHAPETAGLVVLAAEVSWDSGRPQVARVPVDYRSTGQSKVGLALRIGPFSGPFAEADETARFIAGLAADIVAESRAAGCEPAELQIDFDCATSKLAGYQCWVRAVAARVAPTPVTITVLPSWMNSREFAPLARAAGGFVLQVHSLERPRSVDDEVTLCDTGAACRWVEQAAQVGVPFRVALPTYGYVMAYRESGQFIGLIAEADAPDLAPGTVVKVVHSDPAALAQLVRTWNTDRPQAMTGVIWYRMPVAGDRLNWAWPTLASVMKGAVPAPHVTVSARHPEPCLVEVVSMNDGDADAPMPESVQASWSGAGLVAADALGGMDAELDGDQAVRFAPALGNTLGPLRPGEERQIGWLRLARGVEVHIDANPSH